MWEHCGKGRDIGFKYISRDAYFCFFFQAEDGIRDVAVTGVQTCALPILVEPVGNEQSFTENAWIGHTLAIGDEVRLRITGPCGRCVMTTLAQGELPKDSEIGRASCRERV